MDVCRNCKQVIHDADFTNLDSNGIIANRICPYCRKDPRFGLIGRIVGVGGAALGAVALLAVVAIFVFGQGNTG
jgi:hypothetical protein